jgi:hypothetical protein
MPVKKKGVDQDTYRKKLEREKCSENKLRGLYGEKIKRKRKRTAQQLI